MDWRDYDLLRKMSNEQDTYLVVSLFLDRLFNRWAQMPNMMDLNCVPRDVRELYEEVRRWKRSLHEGYEFGGNRFPA